MEPKIIEFLIVLDENESKGLPVEDPNLKKFEGIIPLLSAEVLIQKTYRGTGLVYEITNIGKRHLKNLINFQGNFKDYDFG